MGNCLQPKDNKNKKRLNYKKTVSLEPKKLSGLQELKKNYVFNALRTKVIGAGAFGKVFLTNHVHDENYKVAVKVIQLKKLDQDQLESINNEISILTKLDHPNIVKYYETYTDEKAVYLVMEYIEGTELFDTVSRAQTNILSEKMACEFMKKMLLAINHMHSYGVVHRDIKPENIIITPDGELKFIDFGLSKSYDDPLRKSGWRWNKKHMSTIAGTPYYLAPEVLSGKYDSKCDLWQIGCILYIAMCGYLPFRGVKRQTILNKIKDARYKMDLKEFESCSEEVLDLIRKLLEKDPNKRLSANEALQHPWFSKMDKGEIGTDGGATINKDVLERLTHFKGVSKLKKAAMSMLVKMASQKDLEPLMAEFEKIDKDKTGMINPKELKSALKECQLDISDEEVNDIIEECDYFDNHLINYSEFVMATLDVKLFLNETKIKAVFHLFDADNCGDLTREDIISSMNKVGMTLNQQELDAIMEEHDIDNCGAISFEEFKKLFFMSDEIELEEDEKIN